MKTSNAKKSLDSDRHPTKSLREPSQEALQGLPMQPPHQSRLTSRQNSLQAPRQNSLQASRQDHYQIINWYRESRRPLPWRKNKDPYRIWISEVMLQQTTVAAVVPFYERFMTLFPTVEALAAAPLEHVLEAWSGLGYYSRARNLHRCAQALAGQTFPQDHLSLLKLPGLGPYTSRAIASLAFDEKVGVLDGNVIRILSRKYGLKLEWWKTQGRNQLQTIADAMAGHGESASLNQAMMELGATVCTPQKPTCPLCPWAPTCQSLKTGQVHLLPLKKPQRKSEMWLYVVHWSEQQKKETRLLPLNNSHEAPFLKSQWLLPGEFKRIAAKPKSFDLRHSITHHDIYVKIERPKTVTVTKSSAVKWVEIDLIRQWNPSSLLQKILSQVRSPASRNE